MADPLRLCRVCGRVVAAGTNYCAAHTRPTTAVPDRRGSSGSRGYDHRWRALRAAYLRQHPLCEVCERKGKTTPAVQVHHAIKIKDDRSRRLDVSNLVAVCDPCHRIVERMSDNRLSL